MGTKTTLIIGNGFDLDLGIDISFKTYRSSHYCLSYELDKFNPKGDNWNDFETELRNVISKWTPNSKNALERAKNINQFWIGFWRYFSPFITEQTQEYPAKNVNKSCAYEILKKLDNKILVYTFNYTNPYDFANIEQNCEFTFIHGRYFYDSYVGYWPIESQSENLIIGISDDGLPNYISENEYLRPIIKKYHSKYRDTSIKESLNKSQYVAFFGHSLGITDSDYFFDFFTDVVFKRNVCSKIFILTYNEISYDAIKQNTLTWGIDLDDIDIIKPIYSCNGIDNPDFRKFLELLKQ